MSMQTAMGSPLEIGSLGAPTKKLWTGLALALGLTTALVASMMAFPGLAGAFDETVTATGTSTATFSLILDDADAAFGSNLTPSGTDSNGTGIVDYTTSGVGSYYAMSDATTASVDSNKAWSGNVSAAASTGTSDMSPASNLRWKLGGMASLADASTGANTFSGTNTTVWDTASICASGATKLAGSCTYDFGYSLAVLWANSPGTFSSIITYNAVQAA